MSSQRRNDPKAISKPTANATLIGQRNGSNAIYWERGVANRHDPFALPR
jgi:hypothetical protein